MDLEFANPIRFPPADTSGIIVLRARHRTSRDDLDDLIGRLMDALANSASIGHLWIVESDRIRQYEESAD